MGTQNGISVNVRTWSVNGSSGGGYIPVDVELTNTKGARQVRVAIEMQGYPSRTFVNRVVELSANSRVRFTVSVPISASGGYGVFKLYERGTELEKLRTGVAGAYWYGQGMPSVLLVTRSTPDLRLLDQATNRTFWGQNVQQNMQHAIVAPDTLPTKWIDYTMLDLVVMSIGDLEQLASASREALLTWVLAGGNLLVFGVEPERENSPLLNRLLDLEHRPPSGAAWRRPKSEGRRLDDLNASAPVFWQGGRLKRTRRPVNVDQDAAEKRPDVELAKVEPHFSIRAFGLGQLVAMSSADPFPGTEENWTWVLKSIGTAQLTWTERHGMSAHGGNSDFWNFLIAGVGRAPVGAFELLITVFACVIGPLNYWLLRRRKRLYFLIATVPTLALLTTGLLLGYAMASDGFAIRTRVRSVTLLDQVRGEAVSWSRISYYAGLAPAGGLQFSPDTAVYPFDSDDFVSKSLTVDWTEEQELTSGWLRSRTPTQLLTVAFRRTDEQLGISTGSDGVVRITNRLGTAIRSLVLADEHGELHGAENIALGAKAELEPLAVEDARNGLRTLVQAQRLETPPELKTEPFNIGWFGSRPWYWNQTAAESSTSFLEDILRRIGGDAAELKTLLRPHAYIAVVEQPAPIELIVGVRNTRDAGSLYVIWGTY